MRRLTRIRGTFVNLIQNADAVSLPAIAGPVDCDGEARPIEHLSICHNGKGSAYARTGTLAVRSSLPQLTQAPLMARRIAFQMQ